MIRCDVATIVSCCLIPNFDNKMYIYKVEELEDTVTEMDGNIIVVRDFNAKAIDWE